MHMRMDGWMHQLYINYRVRMLYRLKIHIRSHFNGCMHAHGRCVLKEAALKAADLQRKHVLAR